MPPSPEGHELVGSGAFAEAVRRGAKPATAVTVAQPAWRA
jgi:hypothetical protein